MFRGGLCGYMSKIVGNMRRRRMPLAQSALVAAWRGDGAYDGLLTIWTDNRGRTVRGAGADQNLSGRGEAAHEGRGGENGQPAIRTRWRYSRSAIRPPSSSPPPDINRYAETTHCRSVLVN
jgi:hypothetical protein